MAEMATIGNTRYATPAMAKAIFFVGLTFAAILQLIM